MAFQVGKLILGTFVLSLAWIITRKPGKPGSLPPGPKGLPIIGVITRLLFAYIAVVLILEIRMWLICRKKRNGLHSQNGAVNGVPANSIRNIEKC